jgi:signal transduction histidine kinase
VRQKLIDAYRDDLAEARQASEGKWAAKLKGLEEKVSQAGPYEALGLVINEGFGGLVIYADSGECLYPVLLADVNTPSMSEEFAEAWRLEYELQDFDGAARVYEELAGTEDEIVRLKSLIGQGRCSAKEGKVDEAIEVCKQAAFSPLEKQARPATLVAIANARLLLLDLLKRDVKHAGLFQDTFFKLGSMVYANNEAGIALPSDYNMFLAGKVLEMLLEYPFLQEAIDTGTLEGYLAFLRKGWFSKSTMAHKIKYIAAEQLSIDISQDYPNKGSLSEWPSNQFGNIAYEREVIYGLSGRSLDKTYLLLISKEYFGRELSECEKAFRDSGVVCRITDDSGGFVRGVEQPSGGALVTTSFGDYFPNWKVQLFFEDGDVINKAARRQVVIYIWAGILVIVLILAAGGLAGQTVGRQMKLNRLKNDFIATVSHELKTPLASMRVLVDTLLEGRYRGQQQATEYLQLVSQENERLSRLIDNFLTFSRMERNKQAFEMDETSPAAIAQRAAEAVKTKFEQGRCRFDISIDENLPDVLADRDAMVTMLVNLLDNAYKYSYDEKEIELKVSADDGTVCFRVGDNGIGMSRKAVKKIFNRFYQADRSLARRAEGCGLGLSIVKFIADAHKGTIVVDSKPGKGSVFTVKLPAMS